MRATGAGGTREAAAGGACALPSDEKIVLDVIGIGTGGEEGITAKRPAREAASSGWGLARRESAISVSAAGS